MRLAVFQKILVRSRPIAASCSSPLLHFRILPLIGEAHQVDEHDFRKAPRLSIQVDCFSQRSDEVSRFSARWAMVHGPSAG